MRRRLTKYKRIEHLTNSYSARVKFNEIDALGIVWHGNYIAFFEEGREAFGREHDIGYLEIRENQFTTPIVNVECNYKLSLRYGESYTIKTFIINHPAAKIVLQYEIYNEEGVLVCDGQTVQVFVDLEGKMVLYAPEFYEKWKEKVNFES